MITEMIKDQVIEMGSRHRAGYLVEQAGYTLGLAKQDGENLTALLPEAYVKEVAAALDRVSAAYEDRTLSEEDSKSATDEVNDLLRQAKVWRRAAVNRALRASRMGKKVPDDLLKMGNARSVPAVVGAMEQTVKLLEANAGSLHGADLKTLIEKGRSLVKEIKAIDAEQEVKRLKNLSDAVKQFYYEKGLLFIGIKVINEAGRELHAGDAADAAKYNLSIVYRNMGKRKEKAPTA
ncbi:MAG: hypothetical protein JXD23_14205 [Spirochaetales bacterium]|nr:hypothetical protein [Spirochaetales bacterium]